MFWMGYFNCHDLRSWVFNKAIWGFSPIQATRMASFDFCSAKADLTNLSHKPRPEGRGN